MDCLEKLSDSLISKGRNFSRAADEAFSLGHYETSYECNETVIKSFEEAAKINYRIGSISARSQLTTFSLN